jgi:peroxiredoxin Q/BCP
MNKLLLGFGLWAAAIALPAHAALNIGERAPDFTAQAFLGGKVFIFSLADALRKGPVVLYFYPAAFSKGCTIEAHDFAAAMDRYRAFGATVIGVSHDGIEELRKFSVSECRSKFPVAADTDQRIMRSYDAIYAAKPRYANRTSYVISPAGQIIYTYTNMNPGRHVANTLGALREWAAAHRPD